MRVQKYSPSRGNGLKWRDQVSLVSARTPGRSGEEESTVNQLVNWRMCKKQQMRWSAAGAQLLLHVRTADLNGRLGHYVGRAAANDTTPVAIAA
jgi:hypothetical protein